MYPGSPWGSQMVKGRAILCLSFFLGWLNHCTMWVVKIQLINYTQETVLGPDLCPPTWISKSINHTEQSGNTQNICDTQKTVWTERELRSLKVDVRISPVWTQIIFEVVSSIRDSLDPLLVGNNSQQCFVCHVFSLQRNCPCPREKIRESKNIFGHWTPRVEGRGLTAFAETHKSVSPPRS